MITWSDHAPVSITLKEQHSYNPCYLWRNNTSILSNQFYQGQLSKLLVVYFKINENAETNVMSLSCAHRVYSRGLLIQATAKEKRQKAKTITTLLANLNTLESQN